MLALPDAWGVLRGKSVPADRWDEARNGITLTNIVLSWTPQCEVREGDVWGGAEGGWGDVHAVPLPGAVRPLPWQPGTALVLCEARRPGGGPVPVDPRAALVRVLERAAALGCTVRTGFEVEFYLLDARTLQPPEEGSRCYAVGGGGAAAVLAALRAHLAGFGVPVEALHPEYGPGQYEVSLRPADALEAADAGVLLRHAVKEVAAQHGLVATFMGKPLDGRAGSGLHLHHSLWRDGRNLFDDAGRLSELGRWYLGGLQEAMPGLSLLGTPTPNGMKRRQGRQFAPLTSAWGRDNRTTALRVLEGRADAVRVEQRDASADCNPYLALAGQVAAGLSGVAQRREPTAECRGEAAGPQAGRTLPASVPDAVAALQGCALAADVLDPLLLRTVVDAALHEHAHFAATVSPLELERYARVL